MVRKKPTTRITQYVMITVGTFLMGLSYFIYKSGNSWEYLQSVHSEIFGGGIMIFLIGLIWLLFKIRLDS